MRKFALTLAILGIAALIVAFYPTFVERPVKDGTGPLAVVIDYSFTAPEYHSPLEYWKVHHMDLVNRGDLVQEDCLFCHDPATSCNNCHNYVGANPIIPCNCGRNYRIITGVTP
jgi:hypothetical protein